MRNPIAFENEDVSHSEPIRSPTAPGLPRVAEPSCRSGLATVTPDLCRRHARCLRRRSAPKIPRSPVIGERHPIHPLRPSRHPRR